MDDARGRTVRLVETLTDEDLDKGSPNSIGSVLYHLALIEADWLFDEICDAPDEIPMELFPHEHREANGVLTPVKGLPLSDHLGRLATVRRAFRERVLALDETGFHRVNARAAYDVSPAYVVHHLLQHEAEHRAEINRALIG